MPYVLLDIARQAGGGMLVRLDEVQKAFRDKMTGTKDAPNQEEIDKMDLSHALTTEAEGAIPWRDKLIDPTKLSPKELKTLGIKY